MDNNKRIISKVQLFNKIILIWSVIALVVLTYYLINQDTVNIVFFQRFVLFDFFISIFTGSTIAILRYNLDKSGVSKVNLNYLYIILNIVFSILVARAVIYFVIIVFLYRKIDVQYQEILSNNTIESK